MAKYGDASIVDRIMAAEMWQGMTAEMLTDSWGRPVDRDREVYKTRTTETWKYGQTGKIDLRTAWSSKTTWSLVSAEIARCWTDTDMAQNTPASVSIGPIVRCPGSSESSGPIVIPKAVGRSDTIDSSDNRSLGRPNERPGD